MINISIEINPFSEQISIQINGEPLSRLAKLNQFRTHFIQQAFSLYQDACEEYNDKELILSLCSSQFEIFLFKEISEQEKIFQVIRREFIINTTLQERLGTLINLIEKYHTSNTPLIAPLEIPICCLDNDLYNKLIKKIESEYPELKKIGIHFKKSLTRSSVNIFQNEGEIVNAQGLFAAPEKANFETIFIINDSKSTFRLEENTVYWPLNPEKCFEIIKSYIERFFVYRYIIRLLDVFPKEECTEDDKFHLNALDKLNESVLISLPQEIEIGTSKTVLAKTFLGDKCPPLQVNSDYKEIIDAEVGEKPGQILLRAMKVGNSTIRIFLGNENTPFYTQLVSVVNYDYATSVIILINGKATKNHILSPGDTAQISLEYTPANSPKTKEDVQKGKWSVEDPEIISFDPQKLIVTANKPGLSKLSIRLTRVGAKIPFVVKPKAVDFSLTLQNPPKTQGQEVKYSADEKELEYIKVYIGSTLRFHLTLIPDDAFRVTPIIECSSKLKIDKNSDNFDFSIKAKETGCNETLKIKIPGIEKTIIIIFDIIIHPGTSDTSSRIPTYIGGAIIGTVLVWLMVLFRKSFNIFYLIPIIFDTIALKKTKSDKESAENQKSASQIIKICNTVSIIALLISIIFWIWPNTDTKNIEIRQNTSIANTTTPPCTEIHNSQNKKDVDIKQNISIDNTPTLPGIEIYNSKEKLAPVAKNITGYTNGVIQKLWNLTIGDIDISKSSDNIGIFADFGNSKYGDKQLKLFTPETAYLFPSLQPYLKDIGFVSTHALLKIDKTGEYQISIWPDDISNPNLNGLGYALVLDDQAIVQCTADTPVMNRNKMYTATVKLEAGYHDFLLGTVVIWKYPQSSSFAISIKGEDITSPKRLTVDDLFVSVEEINKYEEIRNFQAESKQKFIDVATSSDIKILVLDKALEPIAKNITGYTNGVIHKLWNQTTLDESDIYNSSKNIGAFVDFGDTHLGDRHFELFSAEAAYFFPILHPYLKDFGFMTTHALLKIDKTGEYQISIWPYDIPNNSTSIRTPFNNLKLSSLGYALILDKQIIIQLKSKGYNADDNKIYSTNVKLEAGYHEFILLTIINWEYPQISSLAISIKGTDMPLPKRLTIEDLFIPIQDVNKIISVNKSFSPPNEKDLPPAVISQINLHREKIAELTKSISNIKFKANLIKNQYTQKELNSIPKLEEEIKIEKQKLNELKTKMQLPTE